MAASGCAVCSLGLRTRVSESVDQVSWFSEKKKRQENEEKKRERQDVADGPIG